MSTDMSHLLVVGDEPRICSFLSEALQMVVHTVQTAESGEDGLRRLRRDAAVHGRH